MTFIDYVIDIGLIVIVLLQVRGGRITTRTLLLPVGIVTYVPFQLPAGQPHRTCRWAGTDPPR